MGFPKYMYKRGTGKKTSEGGPYTAESALVSSEEELAKLGSGWCDSPAEAGTAEPTGKKEPEQPKKEATTLGELADELGSKAVQAHPPKHDDKHKVK